ncbi:MAG: phosphotransferase [Acidobacteriia bacterium]|nr:phosphotransferase [Terriglobia bacterium]
MTETLLITPASVQDYLVRRGLAAKGDRLCVRELGGGVSNIVLLIEWRNAPERRWVLKQSLEKLRVQDDWRSARERVFREAESIQSLRPALVAGSLPEVVHIDRERFLFIMTAAPPGSVVWKDSLLAGEADPAVAREAGRLLAQMVNASRRDPRLRERFEDRRVFDQLRIDPYYRTTAARHPDLANCFEELIADSWKIRTALVHGDYSPKNFLVRDQRVLLIDFEVIHWGDPAFDTGFLLNHLFLKAFYQPRFATRYFEAAREFWQALRSELEGEFWQAFEAMTLRHLGALMLARIDGKSPVEYIRDDSTKDLVRRTARRLLLERPTSLEESIQVVEERLKR